MMIAPHMPPSYDGERDGWSSPLGMGAMECAREDDWTGCVVANVCAMLQILLEGAATSLHRTTHAVMNGSAVMDYGMEVRWWNDCGGC